ncbi:F0F1 ATP synthase subunit B [bacterium]|nr:F0F1 ATP synthase subunit B [bacterium]
MISIDISMVVVMINFLLLMFILKIVLYKPIKDMLNERESKVAADIDDANKSKEEAKKLVLTKEEEYKQAVLEARKLRDKIRKEAEFDAEKILQQAYENRKSIVSETEDQLVHEKKKVEQQLRAELAGLVSRLTGMVLAQKIDSDKDLELINSIIDARSE